MPVVTLVVCGTPLAARTTDVVAALVADGYRVQIAATPPAMGWLDPPALVELTGRPPRSVHRTPTEVKATVSPDVTVVCPATFNSINKAAAGVADTYALGVLCEALGSGRPVLVVPMVNGDLWRHPAFAGSLDAFGRAGARFLDPRTGECRAVPVRSGSGPELVDAFDPRWLVSQIEALLGE